MKKIFLPLYLLLLFSLYFPSILGGRFDLDDNEHLDPPHIQTGISIKNFKTLFTWGKHVDFLPVHNFTHMMEATLSPGSDKLVHLDNIIIFILLTIALYFVFQRFFLLANLPAFLATVAVTINGTAHELVVWINGRKDSLSLLFILVFVLFTNSFLQNKDRRLDKDYLVKIVLLLFLYSLSVFSKSNAVVILPLVTFCYFWDYRTGLKQVSKANWIFCIIAIIFTVSYLLMIRSFFSSVNKMVWHIDTAVRIQMHLVALGHHVLDWIIPFFQILHPRQTDLWFDLNYNYIYLGIFVWICVIATLPAINKLPREIARSFFWIIFFYAPVSGLIFQHPHFYSARFAFPSLVGFTALIFQLANYLRKRLAWKYIHHTFSLLFFVYFIIHLQHNFNAVHRWQESVLVWKHSYLKQPEDPTLASLFLRATLNEIKNKEIKDQVEPYKKRLISLLEEKCSDEKFISKALYSCSHFRETMFTRFPGKKNANYLINNNYKFRIRCKGLLYLKKYDEIDLLLQDKAINLSKKRENEGMRDCRFLYLCFAKGLQAAEQYENTLIEANMARTSTLQHWSKAKPYCIK